MKGFAEFAGNPPHHEIAPPQKQDETVGTYAGNRRDLER
ncbi:hypothetical protein Agau_L300424 [Agrobacterium tumefaciens F2]|nr:hypothetical protein Agau_L300424 [Agrobacterium tumefaciens F2]